MGLVALLALLALFVLPLGRPGSRLPARAALQLRGEGPLRAGAAKARIRLAPGAPLAGYARPSRSWDGTGEDLYARAVALESGGARAVLVALETLLVPAELDEMVAARTGAGCLLLAATHTHSGPGGTWDSALAWALGNGRFDRAQLALVAAAAAEAIGRAQAALRPAEVRWAQVAWPEGPAVSRGGASLDEPLTVARIGDAASLIVYSMHPTSAPRSRSASADWPGAVARLLEAGGFGTTLVLQGAGGDATWRRGNVAPGPLVAERAEKELRAAPLRAPSLECSVRVAALPAPSAPPSVPWPLRRAASNLLPFFAERAAAQVEVRLSGLRLLGVPGEPAAALGRAARADGVHALIGLADGYVGYVETPEAMRAGAGESRRAYFGPDLARALRLAR